MLKKVSRHLTMSECEKEIRQGFAFIREIKETKYNDPNEISKILNDYECRFYKHLDLSFQQGGVLNALNLWAEIVYEKQVLNHKLYNSVFHYPSRGEFLTERDILNKKTAFDCADILAAIRLFKQNGDNSLIKMIIAQRRKLVEVYSKI